MRNKMFAKLLSVTLAVAMALTSFSVPSFAMEGEEVIEVTSEDASFDEEVVEVPEDEEVIEVEEVEEVVSEDEEIVGNSEDAETVETNEETEAVAEEENEFEAISGNTSTALAVNFHANYLGKDKVVKKSINPQTASKDAISVTSIFAAKDIGAVEKFKGWALGEGLFAEISEDAIADYAYTKKLKTVDVYAQWESLGTYTVKYESNRPKGTLKTDLAYTIEHTAVFDISEPYVFTGDEFALFGYVLTGWTYRDEKGGKTVKVNSPSAVVGSLSKTDGATVIVAPVWKPVSYTLNFDLSGGKLAKGLKNKVTYKVETKTRSRIPFYGYAFDEEGKLYLDPSQTQITREGFVFGGWECVDVDKKFTTETAYYGENQFSDGSFRAIWNPIQYTIKFDLNGGQVYDYENEAYISEEVTESATYNRYIYGPYYCGDPEREGYTFKGWKATVNGKAKIVSKGKSISFATLDKDANGVATLVAEWSANTNKIKVDLDGGKSQKKYPTSYKSGAGTVIETPTYDGFKFTGWVIYKDGEYALTQDVLTADGKIKDGVDGDLWFMAMWETVFYSIEFYSNDGSKKYEVGESYSEQYYEAALSFNEAAKAIEATGDVTGSIKGFAAAKGATKADYELNKDYVRFAGKTANADGSPIVVKLYAVTQDQVYRINYDTQGGKVNKPVYEYSNLTKDLEIKATATMAGRVFKGWGVTEDKYNDLVVKDANGFVTAIKAGATGNIELVAIYDDVNKYTVTLMPNAKGVKDAKGVEISSKGVQYKDGETTEFYYYGDAELPAAETFGWTREGYKLVGFSEKANGNLTRAYLGQLGNGKAKDVKLYAVWEGNVHNVTFNYEDGFIYRGEEVTNGYPNNYYLPDTSYSCEQTFGGKAVTLPKQNCTGFTFKGWKINGQVTDQMKVAYTDKTNTYVKSILPTNNADIELVPVFAENSYSIYVDPNGGSYRGNKKKQLVAKVFYTDEIIGYIEDVYANSSKAGHGKSTVALTKKPKKYSDRLRNEYRYAGDENNTIEYSASYGLSAKNGASVVIYPIFNKITPPAGRIAGAGATINDGKLTMVSYKTYSSAYTVEFQYSTSALFLYDVNKVEGSLVDDKTQATVSVDPNGNYYVRMRVGVVDSTGNVVYGAYSKTVRVTK